MSVSFPGVISLTGTYPTAGERLDIEYDRHYSCNSQSIDEAFSTRLDGREVDFLNIGAAVYATDRLSPRRQPAADPYNVGRSRIIELEVPVFDVGFWGDPAVLGSLQRSVEFVSGDARWTFRFVKAARSEQRRECQLALWPTEGRTCLFSGGLDSVAGLAGRLLACPDDRFILVSARTQKSQQGILDDTAAAIDPRGERIVDKVVVPASLRKEAKRREDTQRAKSFFLLIIGAICAKLAKQEALEIYENGIEAFNLPLNAGMRGTSTPRPMHPVFLGHMEDLVGRVYAGPFHFYLPHIPETKAQMTSNLKGSVFESVARSTISCAHSRYGDECGLCTGCLMRRQALTLAGLSAIDRGKKRGYGIDILDGDASDWHRHRRAWLLKATLLQVAGLRKKLESSEGWRHLCQLDPAMRDAAAMLAGKTGDSESDVRQAIMAMFRRYAEEWYEFARHARDNLHRQNPRDWPTLLLGHE